MDKPTSKRQKTEENPDGRDRIKRQKTEENAIGRDRIKRKKTEENADGRDRIKRQKTEENPVGRDRIKRQKTEENPVSRDRIKRQKTEENPVGRDEENPVGRDRIKLQKTEENAVGRDSIKRQKTEENTDGRDRISDMPDAVLCHILSFLPIKICVTTSILSRRWRHIWKDLQVLDFGGNSGQGFEHLAVLVNRVLALRKGYDIRGFRLSCLYSKRVAKCVQTAFGPNLEELKLELHYGGFVVPHTLFTCSRLVSLTLSYGIHIEKPPAVCLPSLKKLKLRSINVDFYETLLSGCPALETLNLYFHAKCLTKVQVPSSLKRLKFQVFSSKWESYLDIDVPGLEHLSIGHATSSFHCKVTNLQHVVDAFLDVGGVEKASVNTFHKLSRALCGIKSLKLGYFSTKMLLCVPVLDFPNFRHLLRLEIIFPCFNSSFLINLLQKCHVLQVLTIENGGRQQKPLHLQSWAQPTRVPNCLRSHLTSVQFKGYQGFEDELEFAEYILRYGFVLKAMNIYSHRLFVFSEKRDIHRNSLYDIRPGSSMCQFYFL